ncbi:hypothetical protein [Rothia kristinae]|uniref:hypothetical protein n=1 Tax=Rothia kristinae TaxID=37923 RepID=UPI001643F792|nr:hypothetical protein [Rothia kristinae]
MTQPPSSPEDPNYSRPQPRYGQYAPQEGADAAGGPAAGAPAPGHAGYQQAPGYGQGAPTYGQGAPVYGQGAQPGGTPGGVPRYGDAAGTGGYVPQPGDVRQAGPAPQRLRTGVLIGWIGCGLALLGSLIGMIDENVVSGGALEVAGGIIGAVLGLGVYVMGAAFLWLCLRGAHWARVSSLVFAIIAGLQALASLFVLIALPAIGAVLAAEDPEIESLLQQATGPAFWISSVLALIAEVAYLVGVLMLWTKPVSRWFQTVQVLRRGY